MSCAKSQLQNQASQSASAFVHVSSQLLSQPPIARRPAWCCKCDPVCRFGLSRRATWPYLLLLLFWGPDDVFLPLWLSTARSSFTTPSKSAKAKTRDTNRLYQEESYNEKFLSIPSLFALTALNSVVLSFTCVPFASHCYHKLLLVVTLLRKENFAKPEWGGGGGDGGKPDW